MNKFQKHVQKQDKISKKSTPDPPKSIPGGSQIDPGTSRTPFCERMDVKATQKGLDLWHFGAQYAILAPILEAQSSQIRIKI